MCYYRIRSRSFARKIRRRTAKTAREVSQVSDCCPHHTLKKKKSKTKKMRGKRQAPKPLYIYTKLGQIPTTLKTKNETNTFEKNEKLKQDETVSLLFNDNHSVFHFLSYINTPSHYNSTPQSHLFPPHTFLQSSCSLRTNSTLLFLLHSLPFQQPKQNSLITKDKLFQSLNHTNPLFPKPLHRQLDQIPFRLHFRR